MNKTDIFLEQAKRLSKMQKALETIFANTYRLEPSVFRLGVLANIEMALGKEEYERLKSLHE